MKPTVAQRKENRSRTFEPTDLRRCMAGDDNGDKGFHYWSVTGASTRGITQTGNYGNLRMCWDQQCPKHGGKNTVKYALETGVPIGSAALAQRKK